MESPGEFEIEAPQEGFDVEFEDGIFIVAFLARVDPPESADVAPDILAVRL